eukprot:m.487926 g.487926  ORF g.487926 m.487926 type:complete len:755 (-) comp25361_c0_seq1:111-2375(-)
MLPFLVINQLSCPKQPTTPHNATFSSTLQREHETTYPTPQPPQPLSALTCRTSSAQPSDKDENFSTCHQSVFQLAGIMSEQTALATADREALVAVVRRLASACKDGPQLAHLARDLTDPRDLRSLLEDFLLENNTPLSPPTLDAIDVALNPDCPPQQKALPDVVAEAVASDVVGSTRAVVWRGDITTLSVDAIVNAANPWGLGCFSPAHACIDAVIHRAAGPRLREACRREAREAALRQTDPPLPAGSMPFVTPGFRLASNTVLHVTGPQLATTQHAPSPQQQALLRSAYTNCLDAALAAGVRSIAFPCISTGLFGYPKSEACHVALAAVFDWLEAHPGCLDTVVFNVFTLDDQIAYSTGLAHRKQARGQGHGRKQPQPQAPSQPRRQQLETSGERAPGLPVTLPVQDTAATRQAARWLSEADAVVLCAGAGMSAYESQSLQNVYVDARAFATHYPDMVRRGYHTAYEAMGILGDPSMTQGQKWGFWVRHMYNMRWGFAPNAGYAKLLELVAEKDYFVHTSNVDGCFERAGFDPARTYTPQGDWAWYQCIARPGGRPCRPDAVFPSKEMVFRLLSKVRVDGSLGAEDVPRCLHCGGNTFGNVRGSQGFVHRPYNAQLQRFCEWAEAVLASGRKLVVLEIGAGFNTPVVTRWPMESLVREAGAEAGALIRINPDTRAAAVPADLPRAVAIHDGWQAIFALTPERRRGNGVGSSHNEHSDKVRGTTRAQGSSTSGLHRSHGHDWRDMLASLGSDRS